MDKHLPLLQHVEDITENTFKLFIAGGFLRDTEHNITPKDVDIMVTPVDDYSDADDFLSYVEDMDCFTITKDLTWLANYLPDMEKRGISGLIMGRLNDGTEVQFIIYSECRSQSFITRDMDMNICQITMSSDGNLDRSDAYIEGFESKTIECLHDYSIKRQRARLVRMSEKYPDFKVIDID